MTYSLVQAGTALVASSGTSASPTCASTTAHNLLVAVFSVQPTTAGPTGLSLPAGWLSAVNYDAGGGWQVDAAIFYYPNCPAGITSVACTFNAVTSMECQILEFHDSAGANTSPLDVTGTITSVAATIAVATSAATSQSGELAVVAFANFASGGATKMTLSPGTGFTQASQYGSGVKQVTHFSADYEVATGAAGVITDSVTTGGVSSVNSTGVIATFTVYTPPTGVTFDAVGPSTGVSASATGSPASLTWNHTCGASATQLLVGCTFDASPDTGTMTAKYNGVAMTSLGIWHTNNATAGFLQVWSMAAPPTGSALAVLINVTSGTATDLNGGSMSFSGSSALSAVQSATGSSTAASRSFTPTVTGNMVAAFCAAGSPLTPTGSFTSRFNGGRASGGQAAGLVAGSSLASTGSAMTASWTISPTDYWAVIAVEVQAGAAAGGILPQQARHRAPAVYTRINAPARSAVYAR